MKLMRFAWILAGLAMCWAGTAGAQVPNAIPGSFAVTTKGQLPNGSHFVRLAMYSFQPGSGSGSGLFRQDFWYWNGMDPVDYGAQTLQIGYVGQPGAADQARFVRAPSKFINQAPSTNYGTWSRSGDTVTIDWGSSVTETWVVSAQGPNLNKIEQTGSSFTKAGTSFYAPSSTVGAVNAGWGFGGAGLGFDAFAPIAQMHVNMSGHSIRFNGWNCAAETVQSGQQMNLASFFSMTNTGVLRYAQLAGPVRSIQDNYSYAARVPNVTGIQSRKIVYQTGHDSNPNGHLDEPVDAGHIYAGLQIMGLDGRFRGAVFADFSPNGGSGGCGNTISSLYYLAP